MAFEVDWNNNLRIISGINPVGAQYLLERGDTFSTPAVLWTYSDKGAGEISRNYHHWADSYCVRDAGKDRPVIVNNWEATHCDFDEARLCSLFDNASKIGAELFLLDDGCLTQAGSETYWDRSTLYALRGTIAAGEVERGMDFLRHYSQRRLLGEHVPYAIEAWPEGDQRHLSAESGLYCRIFTEGLFGLRPTGLKQFALTPRLPKDWQYANLNRVRAFGDDFDIKVSRSDGDKLDVKVIRGDKCLLSKKITPGQTLNVKL